MYDNLKADLVSCSVIPLAEYEWATRPTGDFGTFQKDFPLYDNGDDYHQAEIIEGSVDLYTQGPKPETYTAVEKILDDHCCGAWTINYEGVDPDTKMLHREYVFQTEE